MIAPSTFLFRDFVQYILPTIIALCLFVPFINNNIPVELLIMLGVLSGYIISSPINKLIDYIYGKLPKIKHDIEKYKQERKRVEKKWNFSKLWYMLDEKEREYLFLTGSYTDFFKKVSFYFFIYFLINFFYWLIHFILNLKKVQLPDLCKSFNNIFLALSALLRASSVSTPIPGNLIIYSIFAIIGSFLLFWYTFKSYLEEYQMLFGEGGDYDNFSEKYHKEKGSLALSIWGKISRYNNPFPDTDIELIKNGCTLSTEKSDMDGCFRFIGKYAECIDNICILRVNVEGNYQEKIIILREKQIPYIELIIN